MWAIPISLGSQHITNCHWKFLMWICWKSLSKLFDLRCAYHWNNFSSPNGSGRKSRRERKKTKQAPKKSGYQETSKIIQQQQKKKHPRKRETNKTKRSTKFAEKYSSNNLLKCSFQINQVVGFKPCDSSWQWGFVIVVVLVVQTTVRCAIWSRSARSILE